MRQESGWGRVGNTTVLPCCEVCYELAVRLYNYYQNGELVDECPLCLEHLGEGMR